MSSVAPTLNEEQTICCCCAAATYVAVTGEDKPLPPQVLTDLDIFISPSNYAGKERILRDFGMISASYATFRQFSDPSVKERMGSLVQAVESARAFETQVQTNWWQCSIEYKVRFRE
jgi:hypothetical protein